MIVQGSTHFTIMYLSKFHDALLNDRVDNRWCMRCLLLMVLSAKPCHHIEIWLGFRGERIAVENVGDDDMVAIFRKLVSNQLTIDKSVTKYVWYAEKLRFSQTHPNRDCKAKGFLQHYSDLLRARRRGTVVDIEV